MVSLLTKVHRHIQPSLLSLLLYSAACKCLSLLLTSAHGNSLSSTSYRGRDLGLHHFKMAVRTGSFKQLHRVLGVLVATYSIILYSLLCTNRSARNCGSPIPRLCLISEEVGESFKSARACCCTARRQWGRRCDD